MHMKMEVFASSLDTYHIWDYFHSISQLPNHAPPFSKDISEAQEQKYLAQKDISEALWAKVSSSKDISEAL